MWHGQITGGLEVDLAVGEEGVDLVGRNLDLVHPRPAGGDDVLRVVFVGGEPDRARLHPQRNVLADQRDSLALGGEVGRARQDPRVVGVGPEACGQNRGVAVVQLDMQCAARVADRNRRVQPPVLDAQVIERPQRRTGEPPQLGMVPLALQLGDHHQRQDDLVLLEPGQRPRVGKENRGVEHVGPDGRFSHVSLLKPARPRANLSADIAKPGPGPVLVRSQQQRQQSMSLRVDP